MSDFKPDDLPVFRSWSQQFDPPADVTAYLAKHLTVTAAVVFSELLFPRFIEVRGCVILASRYVRANFEDWWERTGGDRAAVECSLNHVHLWDLFDPADGPEGRALEVLAERMALSWHAQAQQDFPDRSFVADVTDEYGPTVVLRSQIPDP